MVETFNRKELRKAVLAFMEKIRMDKLYNSIGFNRRWTKL